MSSGYFQQPSMKHLHRERSKTWSDDIHSKCQA
jgi:hypothetical protein